MKNSRHVILAALLVSATTLSTSAQSLGLNFGATDPSAAASSLLADEIAGVIPAANWNNLAGAAGTDVGSLVYDVAGAALASGATVTWTSPNTWRSGGNNGFPAGPNAKLLSGYIDTGDTTALGISLTVDNLDSVFTGAGYNVYVYFLSDSPADRGGGYAIDDGITSILKYGSTMGTPSSFIEDPGTDNDNSIDGTYLVFSGLTGSSFTLTTDTTLTTPNGFRAPINAIQIVAVPEPTSLALLGTGMLLLMSWHRGAA